MKRHPGDVWAWTEGHAARILAASLGRFGFLTPAQAVPLTGLGAPAVRRAIALLVDAGYAERVPLVRDGGPGAACRLTRAGATSVGVGARRPAALDLVDWYLAAADLACAEPGWGPWAGTPADAARREPTQLDPAGTLPGRRGPHPVWVILWPPSPALLRRRVLRGLAAGPGGGDLYAPPALLGLPALADLPLARHSWTPPHLRGRRPLAPGWQGARGHLTPVRLALLGTLDRFGHATAVQLGAIHGPGVPGRLDDLARAGLARQWTLPDGVGVWSATRTGQRAAGTVRAPVPVAPATPRHCLALVDLARLLEDETGGRWRTERELRTEHAARLGPGALPPPDGAVDLPDGRRVLVQLELSRARADHLLAFASRHLSAGTGAGVWYVCMPELVPWYRLLLAHDHRCQVWAWCPPAPGADGPRPRRVGAWGQRPEEWGGPGVVR